MDNETLITIDSGYFNAGAVLFENKVITVAPIIKYMMGWSIQKIENYCYKKGWMMYVH